MKDAAGNEISVADGIADWAKENPEFVKVDTSGGFGSNGGKGGKSGQDGVSDVVQNLINAQNANTPMGEGGKPASLTDVFG